MKDEIVIDVVILIIRIVLRFLAVGLAFAGAFFAISGDYFKAYALTAMGFGLMCAVDLTRKGEQ